MVIGMGMLIVPSICISAMVAMKVAFPQASTIDATSGTVFAPFVQQALGYAEIPEGDNVTGAVIAFTVKCRRSATATFKAEIIAPDAYSGSFKLQLDDGSKLTWHTGEGSSWFWSATSPSISITAGSHTVKVLGREDGIKIRALRFESGMSGAGCQWQQAFTNPTALGNPHLTNARGEKFDIHDGVHRLVHFPRGVPEDKALLMVDAKAVDVGHDSDCFSVFLQNVKLFGKWIGKEISISPGTNSSSPESNQRVFAMNAGHEQIDWLTLAKLHQAGLDLNGNFPVTITTTVHNSSREDVMGGEEIILKVGDQHPVLVHLWSSRGRNSLTHDKEVRYLNLEVENLPENSGGILGLDGYSRPSTSQCKLINAEQNVAVDSENGGATVRLLRLSRMSWTASATVQCNFVRAERNVVVDSESGGATVNVLRLWRFTWISIGILVMCLALTVVVAAT